MPKILFRPNATPPPFPPPTPVPTENLVSFAPYPFAQYDMVTASFTNVQNPTTFDFAELQVKSSEYSGYTYVADLNVLQGGTIEPAEFETDVDSTTITEIRIAYFSNKGGAPVIIATVQLHLLNT